MSTLKIAIKDLPSFWNLKVCSCGASGTCKETVVIVIALSKCLPNVGCCVGGVVGDLKNSGNIQRWLDIEQTVLVPMACLLNNTNSHELRVKIERAFKPWQMYRCVTLHFSVFHLPSPVISTQFSLPWVPQCKRIFVIHEKRTIITCFVWWFLVVSQSSIWVTKRCFIDI